MIFPNGLFFALLPDPATADAVALAAKRISLKLAHGGREIPKGNLHLTLMFLGDAVPALEERAACEAAGDIRSAPFDLVLDGAGSFASIWWVGSHKASTELLQFRKSLQTAMTTRKVGYDRQHFVPHVTIARSTQARLASSNIEPILWRCDSFSLMRSALGGQGAAYETVAQWKLATRPVADVGQLSLL